MNQLQIEIYEIHQKYTFYQSWLVAKSVIDVFMVFGNSEERFKRVTVVLQEIGRY